MIKTGVVSITFRELPPIEIIELVKSAGLDAIEWGGDVHVPHGDVKTARDVKQMCKDAGIETPSYGSYYRAGHPTPVDFDAIIETAAVLESETIRIWAGKQSPAISDDDYWKQVIRDSKRVADMAAEQNITVSYEFHGNSLTETNAATAKLLKEVAHSNIRSYWQPPVGADDNYCIEGLNIVGDRLSNLHVFQWNPGIQAHLLSEGSRRWRKFLQLADTFNLAETHYALIEFVKNASEDSFRDDARQLKKWLQKG